MTIWRTSLEWTGPAGGPAYTTLHFETQDPSQGAQDAVRDVAQEYLQTVITSMRTGVQGQVNPDLVIVDPATGRTESIRAVDTTPATSPSGFDALPSAVNALVKIRCGNSSASTPVRGRVYVPWPSRSTIGSDGLPTSNQLTSWAGYVRDMQTSDPLVTFGVWSQKNLDFVPMASVSAYPDWAYLTSRRD